MKNIQYLISHKKGYVHFCRQTPTSIQKKLGPQKRFSAVFSENTAFLKKLLNNKIFSTLFVIKKFMLIFGARCLAKTVQHGFLWKYLLLFEKIVEKKNFIKFLMKKVIYIFGVRWALTSRIVTQRPRCKVKVEGGEPFLISSEISLFWPTSCARDFIFFWFFGVLASEEKQSSKRTEIKFPKWAWPDSWEQTEKTLQNRKIVFETKRIDFLLSSIINFFKKFQKKIPFSVNLTIWISNFESRRRVLRLHFHISKKQFLQIFRPRLAY